MPCFSISLTRFAGPVITPEQRAYLDFMSWSLTAQRNVAAGYQPTADEAARYRRAVAAQDNRDHGEACRTSYEGTE